MIAAASSTCMARSNRPRLVTCGAPATAATMGERPMRAAASRSARGCTWVSASTTATSGCRASRKPALSRSALPRFTGSRTTRQRGSPAAAASAAASVPSTEPSSSTSTSSTRVVGGERRRDASGDHVLLVVGGDQQRDARPAACGLARRRCAPRAPGTGFLPPSTAPRYTPGTARRTPAALQPPSANPLLLARDAERDQNDTPPATPCATHPVRSRNRAPAAIAGAGSDHAPSDRRRRRPAERLEAHGEFAASRLSRTIMAVATPRRC